MSKDLPQPVVEQSEKEENRAIELYEVETDNGYIRHAANNTEDIVFNGYTYVAAAISRTEVETNMESEVEETNVTIQNVTREFSSYVANGGKINGYFCRILTVFRDALDDPLNYSVTFEGEIDGGSLDSKSFSFRVRAYNGTYGIKVPRRKCGPNCEYDFKSEWCGYAGAEMVCDRSFERCKALGNSENFGGFLGVPRIINPQ
jgi:phage-related protein